MACSNVSMIFMCVFSFALFIQMAQGANLDSVCLINAGNFTSNSIYERNLNKLLRDLKSKTSVTGFSSGAPGKSPNQVFGLAQCRGDVSKSNCQACINEATRDSRNLCQNTKVAMFWYDECFLKYSDVKFFGTIDSSNGSILPNFANASDEFVQIAISLLSNLSQEASVASKLFAAGEASLEKSEKIFGFVDCTRDLSTFSCKLCIDALVDGLRDDKNVIGTRVGGRIITASCSIRYEKFPFFNREIEK